MLLLLLSLSLSSSYYRYRYCYPYPYPYRYHYHYLFFLFLQQGESHFIPVSGTWVQSGHRVLSSWREDSFWRQIITKILFQNMYFKKFLLCFCFYFVCLFVFYSKQLCMFTAIRYSATRRTFKLIFDIFCCVSCNFGQPLSLRWLEASKSKLNYGMGRHLSHPLGGCLISTYSPPPPPAATQFWRMIRQLKVSSLENSHTSVCFFEEWMIKFVEYQRAIYIL